VVRALSTEDNRAGRDGIAPPVLAFS